jgi:hypothetical protein
MGGALRFAHLRGLGIPLEDLDRLDVATGTIVEGGRFVEAETGESRLFQAGDLVPLGTWVAQRDLADLAQAGRLADDPAAGPPGFGEGWGAQEEQRGAAPRPQVVGGEFLSDERVPGATGDPANDPTAEHGLTPRSPSRDAAAAGWDQPPVEREVADERDDGSAPR